MPDGGGSIESGGKTADAPAEKPLPLWYGAVAMTTFILANIGLTEFNSWALKADEWPGFHFSFFYTMFHALVGCAVSYGLSVCVVKPELGPPTLEQLWKYKNAMIPLAMCTVINNGLNNASLSMVSLFVNQSIKAILPLPAMILSCLLAGKRYGPPIIITVLSLCVGSVLASYYKISSSSSSSSFIGVILCSCSMLGGSARPVISMMVMKDSPTHPKLSPTVLMCYDSGLSFLMMLFLWAVSPQERSESIAYLGDSKTTAIGIMIICIGAGIAFFFNLSQFLTVKFTSALTVTIASGVVKIILLIASAMQVGLSDPISWSGVGIVLVAIVAYSYLAYTESQQPKPSSEKSPSEKTPLNVKA